MKILRDILLLAAILLAIVLLAMPNDAHAAPLKCTDVQINEGGALPTVSYAWVLPVGGCVRDVLGWHQVEQAKGVYAMPVRQMLGYQIAASAGMMNLVTLAFGNKLYTSNNQSFPTTPAQIEAFKNYAVWVVTKANIPNLYGVSIWNEMNGSFGGGITKPADREAAYAKLVDVVGPAIRSANPGIRVIIGATVGSNIGGWYVHLFRDQHMWGQQDAAVFLDVHPYIGKAMTAAAPIPPQLKAWNNAMKQIRGAGISNRLFATEFGGGLAETAETNFPGLNYVDWAQANIFGNQDFAGVAWFTFTPMGKFSTGTLLDDNNQPTKLGREYQAWLNFWTEVPTNAH